MGLTTLYYRCFYNSVVLNVAQGLNIERHIGKVEAESSFTRFTVELMFLLSSVSFLFPDVLFKPITGKSAILLLI